MSPLDLGRRMSDLVADLRQRQLRAGTIPSRLDELAVRLDRAYRAVEAVKVPRGPFGTVGEITEAAATLNSLIMPLRVLRSVIGSAWQTLVRRPLAGYEPAVERLADQLERILPHVGDSARQTALRERLTQAEHGLGTLKLAAGTAPDVLLRRRSARRGGPSLSRRGSVAGSVAGFAGGSVGRPWDSGSVRRVSWAGSVVSMGGSAATLSRQRSVRESVPAMPRSAGEISAAMSMLDRLGDSEQLREFAAAVRPCSTRDGSGAGLPWRARSRRSGSGWCPAATTTPSART